MRVRVRDPRGQDRALRESRRELAQPRVADLVLIEPVLGYVRPNQLIWFSSSPNPNPNPNANPNANANPNPNDENQISSSAGIAPRSNSARARSPWSVTW